MKTACYLIHIAQCNIRKLLKTFNEDLNVAIFTTRFVLKEGGGEPILYVYHLTENNKTMIKEYEFFLENKMKDQISFEVDSFVLRKCASTTKSKDYLEFISSIGNGGFFFGQSLQFYSLTSEKSFRSIISVNELLTQEFDFLFRGLYSFAQDVFGNQFVFNNGGQILLFNIESGSCDIVAQNFKEALSILINDIDYYAGITYEKIWKGEYELSLDQRIQPKIPFVIGGEYKLDNFYINNYPAYLSYNADIAKQIYNLKDGEKVKLRIKLD